MTAVAKSAELRLVPAADDASADAVGECGALAGALRSVGGSA